MVSLSLPGAAVLTLSGGLLLGWQLSAPATIIAATIGATITFLVARYAVGDTAAAKAGPWVEKLSAGFRENAFSYLLFLRLVPAFPFFVVNLVPALLGVPLSTYFVATLVGIVPATTAFSFLGSGLGSVVEAQNAALRRMHREKRGHRGCVRLLHRYSRARHARVADRAWITRRRRSHPGALTKPGRVVGVTQLTVEAV